MRFEILRYASAVVATGLGLTALGCGGNPQVAEKKPEPPTAAHPAGSEPEQPSVTAPSRPTAADVWLPRIEAARRLIEDSQWDEYQALRAEWADDDSAVEPAAEQRAALDALDRDAAAGRAAQVARDRQQRLTAARQHLDAGRLDEAVRAIGDVLARNPTDAERDSATGISDEVERQRKARRQLKSWMQLLVSSEPKNVQTAQTQLLQDPETAVGMVLEALPTTQPGTAANLLETLRLLNRPEVTLPAMLDLLEQPEHQVLWPELVRELSLVQSAGLGVRLLDLAVKSDMPDQRRAALEILAQVVDPPPQTLVALVPQLSTDGAVLPAALAAAAHAVRVHEQYDWVAGRGFGEPWTAEQEAALSNLAPRLAQLATPAANADATTLAAAEPARMLAALLGLAESQVVTGVKVVRAEAELPESPAAAAVDGIWNSIELKSMWRYPADRRGSILLDLGSDRTVTGIRVWNLNEPNAVQRGWKEIEVYVSASPAELTPAARGLVAIAPGAAGTPDYGITVPVAAIRGRYVRLQAKSIRQADGPTGLAEIQVLASP